jgi:hypothetical protein
LLADLPNISTRIAAGWWHLRTRTHPLQFVASEPVGTVIHAKIAEEAAVSSLIASLPHNLNPSGTGMFFAPY